MPPSRSRTIAVLAVASLLLVALIALMWLSNPAPLQPVGTDSAPASRPAAIVRVGIIVSAMTAMAENAPGEQTGYPRQVRIIDELRDPSLSLYPIVDPGTAQDEAVAAICRQHFPQNPPIDGGDAAQVAGLDVIVASHIKRLPPEVLDSIEHAVAGGTGFMYRMFFYQSGITPQVRALTGMTERGEIRWFSNPGMTCDVVGEHPLLGNLSGTKQQFTISPIGVFGKLNENVEPLIQIPANGLQGSEPYAVVYVTHLGRGAIVGCPFSGSKSVPSPLEKAGPGSFSTRAVKWLAGEGKNPVTRAATRPN